MSYRIHYQPLCGTWRKKLVTIRLPLLAVFCFLFFLALVNSFWPEGAAFIRSATVVLKESTVVMALNRFAEDLFQGEPLAAAFSEFCYGIRP